MIFLRLRDSTTWTSYVNLPIIIIWICSSLVSWTWPPGAAEILIWFEIVSGNAHSIGPSKGGAKRLEIKNNIKPTIRALEPGARAMIMIIITPVMSLMFHLALPSPCVSSWRIVCALRRAIPAKWTQAPWLQNGILVPETAQIDWCLRLSHSSGTRNHRLDIESL